MLSSVLGILAAALLIGALLGKNTLGEAIRGGCGCIFWGVVGLLILGLICSLFI